MAWSGETISGEVWAKRELLRRRLQALTGYRWWIFCHDDEWNMQFTCLQHLDKQGRSLKPPERYARQTPVFDPGHWTRERLEEFALLISRLWEAETVETERGREPVWAQEQRQWRERT